MIFYCDEIDEIDGFSFRGPLPQLAPPHTPRPGPGDVPRLRLVPPPRSETGDASCGICVSERDRDRVRLGEKKERERPERHVEGHASTSRFNVEWLGYAEGWVC